MGSKAKSILVSLAPVEDRGSSFLSDPSTPVTRRHGCRRVLQAAIGLHLFALHGHSFGMFQQLVHIRRVELLNSTKLSVSRIAKTWDDESDII